MSKVQMSVPLAIVEELHHDLSATFQCEVMTNYINPNDGIACLAFTADLPHMLAFNLGMLMAEWQPSQLEWPGGDLNKLVSAFTQGEIVRRLNGWVLYYPLIEVTP